MKCWTGYAGASFLNKNHLPKVIIYEFVSAGELLDVTDVELRCVIAQPSINVFIYGYGTVQNHLHDFGFNWTGTAIDIWQEKPLPVALNSTDNPSLASIATTIQQFMDSRWFYCYMKWRKCL